MRVYVHMLNRTHAYIYRGMCVYGKFPTFNKRKNLMCNYETENSYPEKEVIIQMYSVFDE